MENHTEYAGRMLDEARQLFKAGNHQRSLELYEWFFDHALDEDAASYYGVRLSYCLSEWEALGREYAPAKILLEKKFSDSIVEFGSSRNPERFHDYVSIGEYIGRPNEAIEKFLEYHRSDHALAKEIVRFVWDALIDSEHCGVCGAYVDDSSGAYMQILEKFDAQMEVCSQNPELGGEEFAAQIKRWHRKDVVNLARALIASKRNDEAISVYSIANEEMARRGFQDISFEFSS